MTDFGRSQMPNRDDGTRDQRDGAAANEGRGDQQAGQRGAQEHGEGQHGSKAHQAFVEQLHSGKSDRDREEKEALNEPRGSQDNPEGKHRIFEGRQQHDEADKNSEKNRLQKEIDRRDDLDRDDHQVPGGR